MDINIILFIIIIILLIALIALFSYLIIKNKKDSDYKELRLKINKDLTEFSNKVSIDFNNLTNATTDKLIQIEKSLNSNIIETNKTTNDTFNKISERIIKIDESQKALNELSSNILSLQNILQDKKNRGSFGEIELYNLLEIAYGQNDAFYKKQFKLSNGKVADAVIVGPESLGNIVVDSKFPLENYQRIYDDSLNQNEKNDARVKFKNDVLKHINDIKDKYIIPGETAPMAYMFVPAEAIFSEIYANYDDIVNKSYEAKVYIVSPTTLMAYLTAIKNIFLGQKKDEKAKEIIKLLDELSIDFLRLKERQETLQRDFEKIIPDFEKIAITSNKIIKRFAAINSGDLDNEEI